MPGGAYGTALHHDVGVLLGVVDVLLEAWAARQADTARLDWLAGERGAVEWAEADAQGPGCWVVRDWFGDTVAAEVDLRAALDAAIAGEEEEADDEVPR